MFGHYKDSRLPTIEADNNGRLWPPVRRAWYTRKVCNKGTDQRAERAFLKGTGSLGSALFEPPWLKMRQLCIVRFSCWVVFLEYSCFGVRYVRFQLKTFANCNENDALSRATRTKMWKIEVCCVIFTLCFMMS